MWLDLGDALGPDQFEPLDAVRHAAFVERLETDQLARVTRHDQLAAALVGDLVPITELGDGAAALDAEAGLERPRPVVDAGVDHTAVVAGLTARHGRGLLDHADAQLGVAGEQMPGAREAEDPAPHDRDVVLGLHLRGLPGPGAG